jgi:hypothetical protein
MNRNYFKNEDEMSFKNEFDKIPESDHEKLMDSMLITNPQGADIDEGKWKEAKKISQKTYGEHRWPFIMWLTKEKL